MHGASVNYLDVYTRTLAGVRRSVWNRRGTQGDRWRFAEVQLEINAKTRVRMCRCGLEFIVSRCVSINIVSLVLVRFLL